MMIVEEYVSSQVRDFNAKHARDELERRRIINERRAELAREAKERRMSRKSNPTQPSPRRAGFLRRLLAGARL